MLVLLLIKHILHPQKMEKVFLENKLPCNSILTEKK